MFDTRTSFKVSSKAFYSMVCFCLVISVLSVYSYSSLFADNWHDIRNHVSPVFIFRILASIKSVLGSSFGVFAIVCIAFGNTYPPNKCIIRWLSLLANINCCLRHLWCFIFCYRPSLASSTLWGSVCFPNKHRNIKVTILWLCLLRMYQMNQCWMGPLVDRGKKVRFRCFQTGRELVVFTLLSQTGTWKMNRWPLFMHSLLLFITLSLFFATL